MAFHQEVREYLESLRLPAPEGAGRRIDEDALHAHLLRRLREPGLLGVWVKRQFEEWTPRMSALARHLERLPAPLAPVTHEGAMEFAYRVLDQSLEIDDPAASLVDKLELQRIVDKFVRIQRHEPYALENRLVSPRFTGGPPQLTRAGQIFLKLRGKEAVRWLLTIEIAQSTGTFDPWHASESLLEGALSKGIVQSEWDGEPYWPCSESTLRRLSQLGVLTGHVAGPDDEPYRYEVVQSMRDVVTAVLERGPWHAAIAALLEDETWSALPLSVTNPSHATVDLSRMITHEVRNALVPVRHHIDSLMGSAQSPERLKAARRGVVRVLEFVDQMAATAELITEPPLAVDLSELAREALSRLEGGDRVRFDPPAAPVAVRVPRSRLVVALSNVVMNALQAGDEGTPVRLSVQRRDRMVEVAVDDGGPGVPMADRARVFDDGFSTRPGGSGFGLAFVRRIIEGILDGKVWCEDSDLGGARFVIALPADENQP